MDSGKADTRAKEDTLYREVTRGPTSSVWYNSLQATVAVQVSDENLFTDHSFIRFRQKESQSMLGIILVGDRMTQTRG
jgi:hypothetical protein